MYPFPLEPQRICPYLSSAVLATFHSLMEDSSGNKKRKTGVRNLIEWIVRQDGYVHPLIGTLDDNTDDESVLLGVVPKNKDEEASVISTGATVFFIPHSALLTQSNMFAPTTSSNNEKDDDSLDFVMWFQERVITDTNIKFNTGLDDVMLALYLATLVTNPLEASSSFVAPYLQSLPSCVNLPRHWSAPNLKAWLDGSPIVQRIQKSQQDVKSDYHLLETLHCEYKTSLNTAKSVASLPPLETWDHALAVVTSRAFGDLTPEDRVILIPLLDLCNHQRGATTKNLSYHYHRNEKDQTGILVKATQELHAGTVLCITYGAQGNGPLLLNYGFCLPHNIEPDGSSNTVYDFVVTNKDDDELDRSRSTVIELRAGPKSYSYGGFVKALDQFLPAEDDDDDENDMLQSGAEQDDMEAFLKECEEEDNGFDDEDFDGTGQGGEDTKVVSPKQIAMELEAAVGLSLELQKRRQGYVLKGAELENVLSTGAAKEYSDTQKYYAGLLVQSELRTIYFFELTCLELQRQLKQTQGNKPDDKDGSESGSDTVPGISPDDLNLIQGQVKELVSAYMQIRHSCK